MEVLAPLPFAVPLLVAAVLIGLQSRLPHWLNDLIAVATAAGVSAICCALLFVSTRRPLVYWFGGWVPRQDVAVGVGFAVTPMGAGLASMAALMVGAALVFSIRYFDAVGGMYHGLMLIFLAAMCAFCLTADLFNLLVWFELMSATAYALTAYRIEEKGPLQGALNFAIVNTIGGYLIFSGLALIYGRTGALNFAHIGRAVSAQPADSLVVVAFVLLAAGFLVKASIVPFHFWLADAHAVAPTPVCVLFSGVMVELGVYAVARIYWAMFAAAFQPHEAAVRAIFLGAGAVTAIIGGAFCFGQTHLKRLLAFSTISHVGMFVCGLALLTPLGLAGSAVYVLSHGMVKASLFLCAGILLHRFHTVDEARLHGRGRDMLPAAVLFFAGGLALGGLPPFGTFVGKGMIEAAGAGHGYAWLTAILILASMLTGGAVLRAGMRVFLGLGEPDEDLAGAEGEEEQPESRPTGRTPVVMIAPACVLLGLGLAVGLLPGIGSRTEMAAGQFMNQAGYSQAVLDNAPALQPAGDIEPAGPDPFQVASGLGAAAGSVLLGCAAVYRRRAPRAIRSWAATWIEPPLQRVRALQSGDVRDYVTWLVFGTAGLGAAFAFLVR